ncbi:MAG TPA: DMT family transporter [Acidimicrobiales bacterium]|jgi:hypothetical protein|nr:DMT family transporter [Acidimicrobiales bacterium]
MTMTIIFALLTGLCNALVVAAQHLASIRASPQLKGLQLALYLVKSPLWLLGWIGILAAFVFQALALHGGQLAVVQPLLVSELIFALLLRRLWLHQSIVGAAWASAGVTCVGLSVFIVLADPRGGVQEPTTGHWIWTLIICGGAAVVLYLLGRTGSPTHRAAFLATATALVWALEATFIKTTTDDLTRFGIIGALEHWPIYALAAGGVIGFLVEQDTLHVGPLSVSQPLMVIVDPVVSVCLGVALFDERLVDDPPILALAALSFAVLCIGATVLTRTTPATMTAAPSRSDVEPA